MIQSEVQKIGHYVTLQLTSGWTLECSVDIFSVLPKVCYWKNKTCNRKILVHTYAQKLNATFEIYEIYKNSDLRLLQATFEENILISEIEHIGTFKF